MTTPVDTRYEKQPQHWIHPSFHTDAVAPKCPEQFGNAGGVSFGYDGERMSQQPRQLALQVLINFSAGSDLPAI